MSLKKQFLTSPSADQIIQLMLNRRVNSIGSYLMTVTDQLDMIQLGSKLSITLLGDSADLPFLIEFTFFWRETESGQDLYNFSSEIIELDTSKAQILVNPFLIKQIRTYGNIYEEDNVQYIDEDCLVLHSKTQSILLSPVGSGDNVFVNVIRNNSAINIALSKKKLIKTF